MTQTEQVNATPQHKISVNLPSASAQEMLASIKPESVKREEKKAEEQERKRAA